MTEQDRSPTPSTSDTVIYPTTSYEPSTGFSLKRRASPLFEGLEFEDSRKRMKEDDDPGQSEESGSNKLSMKPSLVDELAEELQCGCCSELVYKPVIVAPCQHFFCGSCCVLWIRNNGTNCPACRGLTTIVTPFRALQGIIDTLLRAAPHKARTERERQQADEIYRGGQSMRIPAPRQPSPEPDINQSAEFARPCPHCASNNVYGWTCPQPIPDPRTDFDHAWHLDDGLPPGHAQCGNCENLLAIRAPETSKCDLCQVLFCGVGVQGRCEAVPLHAQHPHAMSDIADLVQSSDVYDCFDGLHVEVNFMLDYLTARRKRPQHIYREIIEHIQSQPRGFAPLIEQDLFNDVHGVPSGPEPSPENPRNSICRICATEVLLWGLRDWWIRERKKGLVEDSRKDCPDGSACDRRKENGILPSFPFITFWLKAES
ncbi:hypothetical protein L208DRAFT_1248800 [Tricholoma matsutake]|nr:hypothetical protein L208DRAFT_1248800 [Tricholoma matsutake 945]